MSRGEFFGFGGLASGNFLADLTGKRIVRVNQIGDH